ncbi:F-box only protein 15-like [Glandiceps talaboti]
MASSRHKEHLHSYLQSHKSPSKNRSESNKKETTLPSNNSFSACAGRIGERSQSSLSNHKTTSEKPSQPKQHNKPSPLKSGRKVPSCVSLTRRKATIESLPSELILKVFSYLGPNDLLLCAGVCKKWLKLSNDNFLWKKLYQIYVVNVQKKKKGKVCVDVSGDGNLKEWKAECIKRCVNVRNGRVQTLLKKIHPYTGLPSHTQQTLQKLGVVWQLVLTDRNGQEYIIAHSDVFFFPMSATIRWYSLNIPPLTSLKRLTFYGLAPVFYGDDGNALKNSPCQRSLLLQQDFDWSRWSSQHTPDGQDNTVNIYVLTHGLMLATWKEGSELAFVSLCLHNHHLIQRSTMGTSNNIYIPKVQKPPLDDVDTQYGLHGYSCTIELRHQRAVYWGQQFKQLHCDKQNLVGRHARLVPIRSDVTYDHSYTNKKINLPWKTDVFKGIVQDMCILDVTVLDDQNTPMWCLSSPVKLKPSTEANVNFHYEGESYFIDYDNDIGRVHIQLIWDEERQQYAIVSAVLDISLTAINTWFGTKY